MKKDIHSIYVKFYKIIVFVVFILLFSGCVDNDFNNFQSKKDDKEQIINQKNEINENDVSSKINEKKEYKNKQQVINYKHPVLPFTIELQNSVEYKIKQDVFDLNLSKEDWESGQEQIDKSRFILEKKKLYFNPQNNYLCVYNQVCKKMIFGGIEGLFLVKLEGPNQLNPNTYVEYSFTFYMDPGDGKSYRIIIYAKDNNALRNLTTDTDGWYRESFKKYYENILSKEESNAQNAVLENFFETLKTLKYTGTGKYQDLLSKEWFIPYKFVDSNTGLNLEAVYPLIKIDIKQINLENFPKEVEAQPFTPMNFSQILDFKKAIQKGKIGTHCFSQEFLNDRKYIDSYLLDEKNFTLFAGGNYYCEYYQADKVKGELFVSQSKPDASDVLLSYSFFLTDAKGIDYEVIISSAENVYDDWIDAGLTDEKNVKNVDFGAYIEPYFKLFAQKVKNRSFTRADREGFYYFQEALESIKINN